MHIFSNIILTWPQVLHVSQAARVYPGRWQNYYFYRIQSRNPTQIITYSPVHLLQMNRQYYCHDRYGHNKHSQNLDIECDMVTINNKSPPFPEEIWINIPKTSKMNDIIAIHTDTYNGEPEMCYSRFNHYPILTLQ